MSPFTLLQQTALSVPLTARIKVSNTDIGKMKPLLDLTTCGCYPHVLASGDSPQCVYRTKETLKTVKQPSAIKIIFEIGILNSFSALLLHWPQMKPLYISLPRTLLPILWLEFSAYMAAQSISPKLIMHRAYENSANVVRTMDKALGSHYGTYTTGSEGSLTIPRYEAQELPGFEGFLKLK